MNDAQNGQIPQWAKVAAFIVGTIGFPISVAAFLLMQSAGYLPSVDHENRITILRLEEQAAEHRVRQEVLIERLTLGFRIMCMNAARAAQERMNCDVIR